MQLAHIITRMDAAKNPNILPRWSNWMYRRSRDVLIKENLKTLEGQQET